MNVYISADMEGTAGVVSWAQVDPTNTTEYPYYRTLMSREVRAAIEGARSAGAREILVNDSHSSMRNVLWDEMPEGVRMIYGNRKPFSMAEGINESFGAAFFTGYHGAVGQADAVLCHTYTSDTIYNVRMNGTACSEALLNAAVLGICGVPVVLITGDRATVDDAKVHMPWIHGVVTKDAIGNYAANLRSPGEVRAAIAQGAAEAVRNINRAKVFVFASPVTMEIDTVRTQNADFMELIPGFERTGGRTVRYIHDDYRVVFKAFVAAFRLGAQANIPA